MPNLDRAVNFDDIRALAKKRLPRVLFRSVDNGAGNGNGNRRNVARLDEHLFVPRLLREVSPLNTSVTVFGRQYSGPLGVTAFGAAGTFWPRGDEHVAAAARDANIPHILSGAGNASIETIARIAPGQVWYQIYAAREEAMTERMLKRAIDAGIDTLVYTVDFPVTPRSEWLERAGVDLADVFNWKAARRLFFDAITHPAWSLDFLRYGRFTKMETWAALAHENASATEIRAIYSAQAFRSHMPRDIESVRRMWPGKLVIKGVVHPDDALQMIELGADAVTVSNHGGTKLDCMQAAIDSLGPVVEAVEGRVPVFFDGGIRRGAHALVAMCLGASYCFGGRFVIYGLAAAGKAGVSRAIRIMNREIELTLGMLGCKQIDELGPHLLAPPL